MQMLGVKGESTGLSIGEMGRRRLIVEADMKGEM
jgi:hypothetical protein